jgi:hypothetical protein
MCEMNKSLSFFGSYTLLVKDELARPPVIGKDIFTLGIAYPQALLTQEKRAVFLSRAGKILATENFSMKRRTPVSLHLLRKVTYKACRTR